MKGRHTRLIQLIRVCLPTLLPLTLCQTLGGQQMGGFKIPGQRPRKSAPERPRLDPVGGLNASVASQYPSVGCFGVAQSRDLVVLPPLQFPFPGTLRQCAEFNTSLLWIVLTSYNV